MNRRKFIKGSGLGALGLFAAKNFLGAKIKPAVRIEYFDGMPFKVIDVPEDVSGVEWRTIDEHGTGTREQLTDWIYLEFYSVENEKKYVTKFIKTAKEDEMVAYESHRGILARKKDKIGVMVMVLSAWNEGKFVFVRKEII